MTETTPTRTPAAARSTEPTPSERAARTGAPAAARAEAAPAASAAAQPSVPRTLTIRLPLVTITFGPQQAAPVAPAGAAAAAAPAPQSGTGATLEKLAFYGGVAAAGAVGALEWPVAVAVAAGTWVAQHTLPASLRPAAGNAESRRVETPAPVSGEAVATP